MIFGFRFHFGRGFVLRRITWDICIKILDVFGCCGGRRSKRPTTTQTTIITETTESALPTENVRFKTTSKQWVRHPYQYQSIFNILNERRNVIREATTDYITKQYSFNCHNVRKFI
ncbi:unnamed protein product [Auanema sp. JU1783]|nr:unnamed protein product [Auanema sp. JU1783]